MSQLEPNKLLISEIDQIGELNELQASRLILERKLLLSGGEDFSYQSMIDAVNGLEDLSYSTLLVQTSYNDKKELTSVEVYAVKGSSFTNIQAEYNKPNIIPFFGPYESIHTYDITLGSTEELEKIKFVDNQLTLSDGSQNCIDRIIAEL